MFWTLVLQYKPAQGGLANWASLDALFTAGAVADEQRYNFLNDCCAGKLIHIQES